MSIEQQAYDADTERVRLCFRRALSTYHQSAAPQAEIAESLGDMLKKHSHAEAFQRVFEFGSGTGILTRRILHEFAVKELYLNDLVADAKPMLEKIVAERVQHLRFLPGPAELQEIPEDLDLVMSTSTVQWITDLPGFLQRLAQSLNPGGWLAISGFGSDQFKELRALGRSRGVLDYRNCDDWRALIPRELSVVATHQRPMTLYFQNVLQLLRHLRETGVNGRGGATWNRRRLAVFEHDYRATFESGGSIPLTYDPVWIIARKN